MTFRPSIHGWPFGSVPSPGPHALGLGAAPVHGAELGGGLCWAALDRYRRGVRISADTPEPEPGEPLHAELVRRQVAALSGVWDRVADWQRRPEGSWRDRLPIRVGGGRDLASLSRAEWPGIRTRLDRGEPVLLTLLGASDAYRRSRSARQVLATGWTLDDVRISISIYDPSRPGDDDVQLSFGPAGGLHARLTGGERVRGFFAVPYDRVPPVAVRAETFGDRSVIGLNRKVRGRVAPASRGSGLDVVGRSPERALLHFRRERGKNWEGANVTDHHELGSFELYSDPAVVEVAGALHTFSLNYVGDLLHFRLGRRWSVVNRTDQKRAGARFRLAGAPVVTKGPWLRVSVLGTDKDGGLVHYTGQPVRGWRAEQVAGDPLAGAPEALWVGRTLHVVGTTADHRVLHWAWDGEHWTAADLSGGPGISASHRIAGRPAIREVHGVLQVIGRSPDGQLIVFRRLPEGRWTATELGRGVGCDPVAVSGPAGLHLFARLEDGGLLHAWRDGEWRVEDVVASRSSLEDLPETDGLAAWGSNRELRVWGLDDNDLWMLVWREDADWTLERLSERSGVADRHRPADAPIVVGDSKGRPHLFCTDGKGTILHMEPGDWREPDPVAARTTPTLDAGRASQRASRPQPMERTAEVEPEKTRPAATDAPARPAESDRPAKPVRPRTPTKPSRGPAPDLPYLDFELDPAPRTAAEAPEADVREAEAQEAEAPEAEAGEDQATDATVKSDYLWEQESAGPSEEPPAVEPMDLSLLESWPPPPPSARRRKKEPAPKVSKPLNPAAPKEAEEERRREAS